MPVTVPCPTCKKPVELGTPWFPFCSDRCRLIDIGHWHDEDYRIPAVNPPTESSIQPEDAEDEQDREK